MSPHTHVEGSSAEAREPMPQGKRFRPERSLNGFRPARGVPTERPRKRAWTAAGRCPNRGDATAAFLITALYVSYAIEFEIIAYVLLVIAAVLNQNVSWAS
jgi:hypothetical protein